MARDVREPLSGEDRNKYYKGIRTNDNQLARDVDIQGIFYSKDNEPIRTTNEWVNGVKHIKKTVKLETRDYIPDLALDYFVLYGTEFWIVDSIETADIIDNAKPFKSHSNKTIIGLRQ